MYIYNINLYIYLYMKKRVHCIIEMSVQNPSWRGLVRPHILLRARVPFRLEAYIQMLWQAKSTTHRKRTMTSGFRLCSKKPHSWVPKHIDLICRKSLKRAKGCTDQLSCLAANLWFDALGQWEICRRSGALLYAGQVLSMCLFKKCLASV